jgi:hypothetical protein
MFARHCGALLSTVSQHYISGTHRVLTGYSRVVSCVVRQAGVARYAICATVDGSHHGEHSVVRDTSRRRASQGSFGPAEHRVQRNAPVSVLRAHCGCSSVGLCYALNTAVCAAPTRVPTGTPAPTNVGDTNPPTLAPTFAPTRGPNFADPTGEGDALATLLDGTH